MDGRTARALRTRDTVVEALIALLEEGAVSPSVEEIALRAGVSERSIFGHFNDREGLFTAVAETMERRVRAAWGEAPPPSAPLAQRLDWFVDQRRRVYELIAPVRHAGLLIEPTSETSRAGIALMRSLKRREAWRLFSPELAGDHARGAAVAALASFSGWDALRRQQGLDADEAQAALRAGLDALLTPVQGGS
jgi:TetR/AcrR family transcriptional regulator of autoinduction and epiphytic fitness